MFRIGLPDPVGGACGAGGTPVYRRWNRRADSNHRDVAEAQLPQATVAKGYVAEGYGPAAVAMCAP